MHHPVHAGQDLHERAKICDSNNLAGVDVANLCTLGESFDPLTRCSFTLAICGSNVNSTIIVDVDLDIGFFLDSADDLPARSNDRTDLINGDMNRSDARHERS